MDRPGPQIDRRDVVSRDDIMEALTAQMADILGLDADSARQSGVVAMLTEEAMAHILKEEITAREDHGLALLVNAATYPVADLNAFNGGVDNSDQKLHSLAQLAGLCGYSEAAKSLKPDRSTDGDLPSTNSCTACADDKTWYNIHTGPCGHAYCGECLVELFQNSYKDESLFAPRCCQQNFSIYDPTLLILLPRGIIAQYAPRKIEVETTDRTYCHACEHFVPPTSILNSVATCPSCQSTTCSVCKKNSHTGDCPQDEAQQQVLALAAEEGWQRCPGCRNMVELDVGCFHMTCRCGYEFCYTCAARWKSCACPQWSEVRLLQRAAQIVDRDPLRPRAPEQRQQRVEQVAREQQVAHNCNHPRTGWSKIYGRHRCEECHQSLRQFIFECGQCHLRACWRCRCNRL